MLAARLLRSHSIRLISTSTRLHVSRHQSAPTACGPPITRVDLGFLPSAPTISSQLGCRTLTTMADHYDILILGAGQAGLPIAVSFASAGKKTALVEKSHLGGTCVNIGCAPTKTMVASGRVAYLSRRGADYGVHYPGGKDGDVTVDLKKVKERKNEIVTSFRAKSEGKAKAAGVNVLMGEASFTGTKAVLVKLNDGAEKTLTADKIFINTGERPAAPKLEIAPNFPSSLLLNSTSVMELESVPDHLVVLGGGYIGLEFGQLFRRFGSKVTVIQRGPQLLPREDREIAENMLQILQEDGIEVLLNTSATHLSSSPNSGVELSIQPKGGSSKKITGSHLLSAAGRVANVDTLNLPAAGVPTDPSGHVIVNDRLETSVAGIYGLGDVKGGPAFTHVSYDDFRIIRTNLLNASGPNVPATRSVDDRIVPYVVYTDPQLGHVGLHEHEARAKFPNRKIKIAKMPMAWVARALETDESRGMMKAVVDSESGQILGFTCLGLEGGEVTAVVQMAMIGGVRYEKLRDAVWAHPSLAEGLNNLWATLE